MTYAERAERAKKEIVEHIKDGTVPVTVSSFGELHNYVDANGYGGAFEEGAPDPQSEIWNTLQTELNAWIRAGGHRQESATYRCPKCQSTNLDVLISCWAKLYQDGAEITGTVPDEAHDGNHEWTDVGAAMHCNECDHQAFACDFNQEAINANH